MQTTFADRLVQPDVRAIDPLRLTGLSVTSAAGAVARDRQFLSLLQSFRPSGGVSRAQGVTDLLFSRCGQNVGALDRERGGGPLRLAARHLAAHVPV